MKSCYPSYSISLEDRTKHQAGFTPATTKYIQCTDGLSLPKPTLQGVLNWIDGQAAKVHDAINAMRQNQGTKTIMLHARLPIGITCAGACKHKNFDILANGEELTKLKERVQAVYKSAIQQ